MTRRRIRRPPGTRTQAPKIAERDGQVSILCPFCHPAHPIMPDRAAGCGTVLRLEAVQVTFSRVACALCGSNQEA